MQIVPRGGWASQRINSCELSISGELLWGFWILDTVRKPPRNLAPVQKPRISFRQTSFFFIWLKAITNTWILPLPFQLFFCCKFRISSRFTCFQKMQNFPQSQICSCYKSQFAPANSFYTGGQCHPSSNRLHPAFFCQQLFSVTACWIPLIGTLYLIGSRAFFWQSLFDQMGDEKWMFGGHLISI